jgi:thioredoxin-related protein
MFAKNSRTCCACLVVLAVLASFAGCGNSGDAAGPDGAAQTGKIKTGNLSFVTGYEAGYRQAQQAGRPMLVFFSAEWCHYCNQMAAESFTDERVTDLSKQFTCVLVDADAETAVCEHFRVRGFPTIQFFAPSGVPLNRAVGKQSPEQLLAQMKAALDATARRVEPVRRRY